MKSKTNSDVPLDIMIDAAAVDENCADEIADTIVTLAERPNAVFTLIQAYREAVLAAERHWQEAEARPEYKFASRYDAQIDYARRHADK